MNYNVKWQHLEYLNVYQHLSFSLQCNADSGNIHYDENFGRKKKAQFLLLVFQKTGSLPEFDSCLTFFY